MQERLQGLKSVPSEHDDSDNEAPFHNIILGIDPSLRGTGYGVIKVIAPSASGISARAECLCAGTIKCSPKFSRSFCLYTIGKTLRDVIRKYRPTVGVFESLFFAHNQRTAIVMGEARGTSLFVASEEGLDIYEMSPTRAKQAIVGFGRAQKLAVAKMIQRILSLDDIPEPDAGDALALAVAYMQESGKKLLNSPLKKL